ncbi:MAG: hypothetical protein NW200_08050 [Hyphomonadaceae bacterium]|nr:hypothetical protein [Hyphomonadaceae bacterium]
MAYLIGQLLAPLAIAAVFGGGLAGWSWHCIRNRDRWAARDAERDRLRDELLTYVGFTSVDGGPIVLGNTELEAMQVRLETANEHVLSLQRQLAEREDACGAHESRIAELEMALASARAANDEDRGAERFAAMEAALRAAEAKAAEVERRAAELESALDNAQPAPAPANGGVDVAAMSWRLRQLEAERAARDVDANIARVAAQPEPPPPTQDLENALNRQSWRARYLQARVDYLEGLAAAPAPAPVAPVPAAPVDEEADNRKRWRQRYLEARVAWLEGRTRDAHAQRAALAADVAARDVRVRDLEAALAAAPKEDPRLPEFAQRIAELEGALAAARAEAGHGARRVAELEAEIAQLRAHVAALEARPAPEPVREVVREPDPEAGSLRWRSRYLDSRVRFLEQAIASTPRDAGPAPAAPRDQSFAPLAPTGAEIRPAGLPAPRDGARDDLRLIAGVDPRIESTLNSLGVYHFDQIAAWTPANVDWVERYLAFKGRIGREGWVAQAAALARGDGVAGRRRYLEDEPA